MLNCFLISVVQLSGFSSLFPHGCLSSIRMPIIHLIPFLSANADICHFSEKKNKKFPNQFAPLCVFSLLDLRWEVVRNVLHLNHVEFIGPLPTLFFHQHLHPSDCMQDPPFQNVQMKSSDLELQLPSLHSSLTPLMWWSRTACCKSHQIFFCNAPRLCFYLFIFIGIDGKAAYLRLDEHKGSFSSMWLLMLFDMMMSSFRRKSRFDATWGELFLKSDETWWNAAFPELLPKPSATHPIADRKSVSPWSFSRRKQFEHPSQGRVKTTFSGGGWLETIKAIESEGGTSELARWMVWIALCWMDYGHTKKKRKNTQQILKTLI